MRILLPSLAALCVAASLSQGRAAAVRIDQADGWNVITVAGPTGEGDPRAVEEVMERGDNGLPTRMVLSGPGGQTHAGMMIGLFASQKGIVTRVEDGQSCLSACALAWLGGTQREMGATSQIGLHTPYDPRTRSSDDVGQHAIEMYVQALGLPSDVADYINTANRRNEVAWMTPDAASRTGLEVNAVDAAESTDGGASKKIMDVEAAAAALEESEGPEALMDAIQLCDQTFRQTPDVDTGLRCYALSATAETIDLEWSRSHGRDADRRFSREALHRRLLEMLAASRWTREDMIAAYRYWDNAGLRHEIVRQRSAAGAALQDGSWPHGAARTAADQEGRESGSATSNGARRMGISQARRREAAAQARRADGERREEGMRREEERRRADAQRPNEAERSQMQQASRGTATGQREARRPLAARTVYERTRR